MLKETEVTFNLIVLFHPIRFGRRVQLLESGTLL